MKYKLETIPVWDAVKRQKAERQKHEMNDPREEETARSCCFLCRLMEDSEQRYIDYYLGSSVMNPETRVQVNSRGFCPHHYLALTKAEKPQALALIAHTHLLETRKTAKPYLRRLQKLAAGSNGVGKTEFTEPETSEKAAGADSSAQRSWISRAASLFSTISRFSGRNRRKKRLIAEVRSSLEQREGGCLICESMQKTLNRYMFTFIHLWTTDPEFRKAYAESGGICLHHFPQVLGMAFAVLSPVRMDVFLASMSADLEKRMDAAVEDVGWMTQLFKHEHAGKEWKEYKQAHKRAVQLETGTVRIFPQRSGTRRQ